MGTTVKNPVFFIKTPEGFSVSTELTFKVDSIAKTTFENVCKEFDAYIQEIRNDSIKKIAQGLGMNVKWTD